MVNDEKHNRITEPACRQLVLTQISLFKTIIQMRLNLENSLATEGHGEMENHRGFYIFEDFSLWRS